MAGGYLTKLGKANIEVRLSQSPIPYSMYGETEMLRFGFYRDGEHLFDLEQDLGKGKKQADGVVYRAACLKLGLCKNWEPTSGEAPEELGIEREGGRIIYSHPSFLSVQLTKFQGRGRQFMSPIDTHGGMGITISTAELRMSEDTCDEYLMPDKEIMRIEMSFTQFAEFITSAGEGSGVPGTLIHYMHASVPQCKLPSYKERIEEQTKKTMEEASKTIADAYVKLEKIFTEKGPISVAKKKEIWDILWPAMRNMTSHPPFMIKMFAEYIDKALVHAKSEFAVWAEDKLRRKHEAISARQKNPAEEVFGELPSPLDSDDRGDL